MTDAGSTYYFSRLCPEKELGMYLGVTGNKVIGQDTVKYGLATRYVKHSDLERLRREIIGNFNYDNFKKEDVLEIINHYS